MGKFKSYFTQIKEVSTNDESIQNDRHKDVLVLNILPRIWIDFLKVIFTFFISLEIKLFMLQMLKIKLSSKRKLQKYQVFNSDNYFICI